MTSDPHLCHSRISLVYPTEVIMISLFHITEAGGSTEPLPPAFPLPLKEACSHTTFMYVSDFIDSWRR